VRRALRPLERVSGEIRARDPSNFDPIDSGRVPDEVRPLIGAINQHLERALADARNLREFTANAAHQLRTPIAVLQARIEVAMQRAQSNASAEELGLIHDAALRISRLTGQLLSLARLSETGSQRERTASLDLKAEVDALASEYVHQAIRKGVDLGFELQPARMAGNDWLIREAIGNVINNAIEYTPRGGEITVRTGVTAGGQAFVEVQDNGPGIPPHERPRVMERFYRLPGAAGTGSGLGLPIVQAIARDHGGTVQILDPAEGAGCVVRVEFPAIKGP
jgi:two-component system sensor histidine kinase TctE